MTRRAPTQYSSIPPKYPVPQQASIDGNTVEMEVERAKSTENALMYPFSMDRVGGSYKEMLELLKNLTSLTLFRSLSRLLPSLYSFSNDVVARKCQWAN